MANLKGNLGVDHYGFFDGDCGSALFSAGGPSVGLGCEAGLWSWRLSMDARWYVLHVYSGFENKVAQSIREQAGRKDLDECFQEILVPTEEVIEIKRGVKTQSDRKFYPGYVLLKMVMTDESWHLVKDTPKVTGFLGGRGRPVPISEKEAESIMSQVREGLERPRSSVIFEIGELIQVADGPFASFTARVEVVDEERSRLKVSVSIFGRETPVDLEFSQVEKLAQP